MAGWEGADAERGRWPELGVQLVKVERKEAGKGWKRKIFSMGLVTRVCKRVWYWVGSDFDFFFSVPTWWRMASFVSRSLFPFLLKITNTLL